MNLTLKMEIRACLEWQDKWHKKDWILWKLGKSQKDGKNVIEMIARVLKKYLEKWKRNGSLIMEKGNIPGDLKEGLLIMVYWRLNQWSAIHNQLITNII